MRQQAQLTVCEASYTNQVLCCPNFAVESQAVALASKLFMCMATTFVIVSMLSLHCSHPIPPCCLPNSHILYHITSSCASQINAGKVTEAIELLDSILAQSPNELSARVARGTARALARNLEGAVDDFSKAIELEPR